MDPGRAVAHNAGSREVEPRKRKRTPSDSRRRERRALEQAEKTASQIQGTARERQRGWAEGGRPLTTISTTRELGELYDQHRGNQKELYDSGAVPRPKYDGKTSGLR